MYELKGICDGSVHMRFCGKMDHCVKLVISATKLIDSWCIDNISFDKGIVWCIFNILSDSPDYPAYVSLSRLKIWSIFILIDKKPDNVRADEAGAAGD
jgi:hypothetical protein